MGYCKNYILGSGDIAYDFMDEWIEFGVLFCVNFNLNHQT